MKTKITWPEKSSKPHSFIFILFKPKIFRHSTQTFAWSIGKIDKTMMSSRTIIKTRRVAQKNYMLWKWNLQGKKNVWSNILWFLFYSKHKYRDAEYRIWHFSTLLIYIFNNLLSHNDFSSRTALKKAIWFFLKIHRLINPPSVKNKYFAKILCIFYGFIFMLTVVSTRLS